MIRNKLSLVNNNRFFLPYLFIICGVFFGTIIDRTSYDFYNVFSEILTSVVGNIFLFASLYIIQRNIYELYFTNYNYLIRTKNYKATIRESIKDIILYSVYFYVLYVILTLSISLIMSLDGFNMTMHSVYNVNMFIYDIYIIIRNAIIFSIIISIIFSINIFNNKKIEILILVINILFYGTTIFNNEIHHFYNLSLIPQDYLTNKVQFSNIFLDIICTSILIIILFGMLIIIFKIISKKKRDTLWKKN